METGTIEKLLNYYLTNEKFKSEIDRALEEFFDLSPKEEIFDISEEIMPYFNEWLVFDFKLSNGQTIMEDYYNRNPYNKT